MPPREQRYAPPPVQVTPRCIVCKAVLGPSDVASGIGHDCAKKYLYNLVLAHGTAATQRLSRVLGSGDPYNATQIETTFRTLEQLRYDFGANFAAIVVRHFASLICEKTVRFWYFFLPRGFDGVFVREIQRCPSRKMVFNQVIAGQRCRIAWRVGQEDEVNMTRAVRLAFVGRIALVKSTASNFSGDRTFGRIGSEFF